MRVLTILGTRPEIIRLSQVIPKLDSHCDHVLLHTGQNFTEGLSRVFFRELGVREPDVHLGVQAESAAGQIGQILVGVESTLRETRPDRVLILGDTNSALSSIIAKRMGIPVFHMEAGNRCFDDRVPEEVNRRLVDHSSEVLLPYTNRSKENLLREGIPLERIFVTGNPILEVIERYGAEIDASTVQSRLGVADGDYVLVTTHRAETVDHPTRLRDLLTGLELVAKALGKQVICSLHPRTRNKMETFGFSTEGRNISFVEPLGFFDFVRLERGAACVITDSGTVQEECSILRIPNVTVRDVTERPETVECGSNVLAGTNPETVASCVQSIMQEPRDWNPPPEYMQRNVSSTVLKILIGVHGGRARARIEEISAQPATASVDRNKAASRSP